MAEAFQQEAGYRAARRLVAGGDPPTAILCANDLVALGALRAAREAGLECPEQISLVGFNDIPFAEFFAPPLTTVRIPQREMGVLAAGLLLAAIEAQPITTRRLLVEAHLVVRGSTAAPARASARIA